MVNDKGRFTTGISALLTRPGGALSFTFSTMGGHQLGGAIYGPGKGPHQVLTLLVPGVRLSSLWNCKE